MPRTLAARRKALEKASGGPVFLISGATGEGRAGGAARASAPRSTARATAEADGRPAAMAALSSAALSRPISPRRGGWSSRSARRCWWTGRDRAAASATGWRGWPQDVAELRGAGHGRDPGLVRLDRARAAGAGAARRAPLALEQSQAAAAVGPDPAGAGLREVLAPHGITTGAGAGDAGGQRGPAALSEQPRRRWRRCWASAWCRSSTRTTRWRPTRSATATTTGWRRRSRRRSGRTSWCCCPTWTGFYTGQSRSSTRRRGGSIVVDGDHAGDRGDGGRCRSRALSQGGMKTKLMAAQDRRCAGGLRHGDHAKGRCCGR